MSSVQRAIDELKQQVSGLMNLISSKDYAIATLRENNRQQAADIKALRDGIKDLGIAHEMSHAAFCDSGHWRDEFNAKLMQLLAATDPNRVMEEV